MMFRAEDKMTKWIWLVLVMVLVVGCEDLATEETSSAGERATVVRVIDGDTIEVRMAGAEERVRYIGVNTPESDEPCYQEALNYNLSLVQGKEVTLVQDKSERDQYGRLLRYVYVGKIFVNEELVKNGYAEAVLYNPDRQFFNDFSRLEQEANRQDLACHATGIFDDGSDTR